MTSKISKPKAKLKFAQSNINYVYKGNTVESQVKSAVRQYGMQVVGKLQGTRRLPPPAWVPSIKAETGGLDTRVALVPPGGSGWSAPSETTQSPPTTNSAVISSVPSYSLPRSSTSNDFINRELISSSFEPDYTRSKFGLAMTESLYTSEGNLVLSDASVKEPCSVETVSTARSGSPECIANIATAKSAWTSRTQVVSASGGLSANKPFFQRPAPVVASSASSAVSSHSDGIVPATLSGSIGASEIVGEPAGWAILDDQEPDFDERILFSDEDDGQSEDPILDRPAPSIQSESFPEVSQYSQASAAPTVHSLPSTLISGKALPEGDIFGRPFPNIALLSSDLPSRSTSGMWPTSDALPRFVVEPTQLCDSYSIRPVHCLADQMRISGNIGADDRFLPDDQFFPQPTPGACSDSYFSPKLSSGLVTKPGVSIDSPSSGDIDMELQNIQRQVRTQEFKSAVERAQQARLTRQKSDLFNTNSEFIQRSLAGLLLDSENTASTFQDSKLSDLDASALRSFSFTQNFMPPTFKSTGNQSRSELVAALAAAAAVAVACNENSGGSTSVRSSDPVFSSVWSKIPRLQQFAPVDSSGITTNSDGNWNKSTSASSNFPDLCTLNPSMVHQFIQSILSPGGVQGPVSGSQPNELFWSQPEVVKQAVELINAQQSVRPQVNPAVTLQSVTVPTEMNATTDREHKTVLQVDSSTALVSVDNSDDSTDKKQIDEQLDSKLKMEHQLHSKPKRDGCSSVVQTSDDSIYSQSVYPDPVSGFSESKSEVKRVPDLMDIKVSSASRNFSFLCYRGDYFTSNSSRNRGRSKSFRLDKMGTTDRSKHHTSRYTSDDSRFDQTKPCARFSDNGYLSYSKSDRSQSRNYHTVEANSGSTSIKTKPNSTVTTSEVDSVSQRPLEHVSNRKTKLAPDSRTVPSQVEDAKHAALSDIAEEVEVRTEGSQHRRTSVEGSGETVRRTFVSSPKSYSDTKRSSFTHHDDGNFSSDRNEYCRQNGRSRRGRGMVNHYHSRTFYDEDPGSQSSYHPYAESRFSPRSSRVASFASRGRRGTINNGVTTGSYECEDYYESRDGALGTDPGFRRVPDDLDGCFQSFRASNSGERLTSSESRAGRFAPGVGPQPQTTHRKTSSDIESSQIGFVQDRNLHERNEQKSSRLKQRTTDSKSRTHKSNFIDGRDGTYGQADNHCETSAPIKQKSLLGDFQPTVIDSSNDVDIPTVRVPATDTSLKPQNYYSHSRGGRPDGASRVTESRRGSSKSYSTQQTKRTSGSVVYNSRRYRDMRGHYREDRDDEGGASAGGPGRSTTNSNFSGGNSISNSSSNVSHDQRSVGNRNSKDRGTHQTAISLENPVTKSGENVAVNRQSLNIPLKSFGSNIGVTTAVSSNGSLGRSMSWRHPKDSSRPATQKYSGCLTDDISYHDAHTFGRSSRASQLSSPVPFDCSDSAGPSSSSRTSYNNNSTKSNLRCELTDVTLKVTDAKTRTNVNQTVLDSKTISRWYPTDGSYSCLEGADSSRTSKPKLAVHRQSPSVNHRSLSKSPSSVASCLNSCSQQADSVVVSNREQLVPNKGKRIHPKPSFMGPPLCIDINAPVTVTVKTSSIGTSRSLTTSELNSNVPFSTTVTVVSSVDAKQNMTAISNRIWSKVVGSKAVSTCSSSISSPISNPTARHSTFDVALSNPVSSCNLSAVNSKVDRPTCREPDSSPLPEEKISDRPSVLPARSVTALPCKPIFAASTVSSGPSTNVPDSSVINNICKVRPQQQQASLMASSPSLTTIAAGISPNVSLVVSKEHTFDESGEVTPIPTASTMYPGSFVQRPVKLSQSDLSSVCRSRICADGIPTQLIEGGFPHFIAVPRDTFTSNYSRMTSYSSEIGASNLQFHDAPSDVFTNLFATSSSSSLKDPLYQAYHNAALSSRDPVNDPQSHVNTRCSPGGAHYGLRASAGETDRTSGSSHSLYPAFPSTSTMSNGPLHESFTGSPLHQTHQFPLTWTASSNHQQVTQRQLHSHQLEQFGHFPFADVQNEFAYLPSAPGYAPTLPSGGLYSHIQGRLSSNYPNADQVGSCIPPTSLPNVWSTITGTSLQTSAANHDAAFSTPHTFNTGGNSFSTNPSPNHRHSTNNPSFSFQMTTQTSQNQSHRSYLRLSNESRSATHLAGTATRQVGFATPNLAHPLQTHGQPQYQVPPLYYPSLSSSHQQLNVSPACAAINNLFNPQSGLCSFAYGGSPASNQPVHPPPQSHSFSTGGVQQSPHGHRSAQSSGLLISSRNLGATAPQNASPLILAGTPGLPAVSPFPGYNYPVPTAGYSLNQALPTH